MLYKIVIPRLSGKLGALRNALGLCDIIDGLLNHRKHSRRLPEIGFVYRGIRLKKLRIDKV